VIGLFTRVFFVRLRTAQFTFLQEGDSLRGGGGGIVGFGFQFGGLEEGDVAGWFIKSFFGVCSVVEGGGFA
jgi:hypothetical protein